MIPLTLLNYLVPIAFIAGLIALSFKIVAEYERLVVLFLGRLQGIKNPGLRIIVPGIQKAFRVDLRVVTMDIPPQDVISRDNVTVRVNAVLYFRVVDPEKAIIQVENYLLATNQLAQTTLRSVLGQHELDEMLSEREKLNTDIQEIIDMRADAWGIKVINVEIKHIDLNESMVRAIARQAEAERERRAKVIHAEGEFQASEKLLAAANVIIKNPQALQLRYLQTLADVAAHKTSNTIVFPIPMEMMHSLVKSSKPEPPEQLNTDS
ncbi:MULTISPECIES: slipin family protein [Desulfosediminicola]|uniref:slipin family protein n=1 Tax=Desulfosediminicola TaxID=2886823 RepID=UPI0010AB7959|nr:slipin family protein [Desulfosediminicola ganghwensis]